MKQKKVYVGLSGGVDSSLAAALLVEQGYDVTGVYMKNWTRDLPGMKCPWAEDLADAKRVAVALNIPFKVFDFQKEYKQKVVDYMIAEYAAGRTPNPDIMCNQEVKFKLFLETALEDGADFIATGHYARRGDCHPEHSPRHPELVSGSSNKKDWIPDLPDKPSSSQKNKQADFSLDSLAYQVRNDREKVCLIRAKDEQKDQTYFLYRMSREALSKSLFPIGDFSSKDEVRKEAAKRNLPTAGRKDSQGICFVGEVGVRDFLSEFVETELGDIIEQETGEVVGRHDGAIFYTLGQRHGLNIGGGLPFYVVGKNMEKNEVFVSRNLNNPEFFRDEIVLQNVHWINDAPDFGKSYQARFRHRGQLVKVEILKQVQDDKVVSQDNIIIKLSNPQRAIAPGQSVVIYDGDICLGGGIVR